MSRFRVGIVGWNDVEKQVAKQGDAISDKASLFPRCFEDFVRAMASALRSLGHEVKASTDPPTIPWPANDGRFVVLGGNRLMDAVGELPATAIFYNAEQLLAVKDLNYFMHEYLRERQMMIWDFSASNVERLKQAGFRAVHCPVAYDPAMITSASERVAEDIDVLHYGSIGPRRREILDAMDRAGLKVSRLFGAYGKQRDEQIARAKVVLNLHYHPRCSFEVFRGSHIWANRKCLLTEAGGGDPELEELAQRTSAYVPRERIVEECRALVASVSRRRDAAERGFEEFSKTSLKDSLSRAIEQS